MLSRNARIGLVLFAIYLLFYGGFVLLSALVPEVMEVTPVAGVNLAILYGFALIVVALGFAGLYGWLCRVEESKTGGGRP